LLHKVIPPVSVERPPALPPFHAYYRTPHYPCLNKTVVFGFSPFFPVHNAFSLFFQTRLFLQALTWRFLCVLKQYPTCLLPPPCFFNTFSLPCFSVASFTYVFLVFRVSSRLIAPILSFFPLEDNRHIILGCFSHTLNQCVAPVFTFRFSPLLFVFQ